MQESAWQKCDRSSWQYLAQYSHSLRGKFQNCRGLSYLYISYIYIHIYSQTSPYDREKWARVIPVSMAEACLRFLQHISSLILTRKFTPQCLVVDDSVARHSKRALIICNFLNWLSVCWGCKVSALGPCGMECYLCVAKVNILTSCGSLGMLQIRQSHFLQIMLRNFIW